MGVRQVAKAGHLAHDDFRYETRGIIRQQKAFP